VDGGAHARSRGPRRRPPGGTAIAAGDRVHPVNAAANRDPARYGCPDSLDLDRRGFASHLAFNVGPRHCVGAALARLEAVEAIAALLRRVPADRPRPDPRAAALRRLRVAQLPPALDPTGVAGRPRPRQDRYSRTPLAALR
jgi:cytochrome P450